MNNIFDCISRLKGIAQEIYEYPYGKENPTGKTLPPNPHHYAKLVDSMIDILIQMYNNGYKNITRPKIDEMRSLRANQVEHLIADYSFTKNKKQSVPNDDMEKISLTICNIISIILREDNTAIQ